MVIRIILPWAQNKGLFHRERAISNEPGDR